MFITGISEGFCRQQHQQRPQPFAAGVNNIMTELVHQRDIRAQTLTDNLIHRLHIIMAQRHHIIKIQLLIRDRGFSLTF